MNDSSHLIAVPIDSGLVGYDARYRLDLQKRVVGIELLELFAMGLVRLFPFSQGRLSRGGGASWTRGGLLGRGSLRERRNRSWPRI